MTMYTTNPNRLETKLYAELVRVLPHATIRQQYCDVKTGYTYDIFLPDYKIVIEIQSWAFHGLPIFRAEEERTAKLLWDEEMKRQRSIAVAGYYYFPFSGRDIHFEAWQCARLIQNAVRALEKVQLEDQLEEMMA